MYNANSSVFVYRLDGWIAKEIYGKGEEWEYRSSMNNALWTDITVAARRHLTVPETQYVLERSSSTKI